MFQTKRKYSLRKLSVGVASVLLGISVVGGTMSSVHAANDTVSVISNKKIIDTIAFSSANFSKMEEGVTIPSGNITVESGTNVDLTNTEFRTEVQKLVDGNWVSARDVEQRYQANGVYRLSIQVTTPMRAASGYIFNTTTPTMTLNGTTLTDVQWGVVAPTQETEQANFIGYTQNITVQPKETTGDKAYTIRYENAAGTLVYKTTGTTANATLTAADLTPAVADLQHYDVQTTGVDLTVTNDKVFVVRVTPKVRQVEVPYEIRYVDTDSRVIYKEIKKATLESTVLSTKASGVVTEKPKSPTDVTELVDYTLVDTQEKSVRILENGHENIITFTVNRKVPTKQVTVTYHANKMQFGYRTSYSASTGVETWSETLSVENTNTTGDSTKDTNRLLGKYNERKSDDNGKLNQIPQQYEHERLAPGVLARMTHGWDTGSRFEVLLGLAKMYRFVGWNTKQDGTGVWYGPGQTLTGDVPENLTLYAQFSDLMDMLDWGTTQPGQGLNKSTPSIYLDGSKEHTTKETAYVANKPEGVSYKADLNFEGIRDEMVVFYNRISRIDNADVDETTGIRTSSSPMDIGSGLLKARFSNKLVFSPTVRVRFTSTWMTLMNNDTLGVTNMRVVGRDADGIRYIYEADVDTTKTRTETITEMINGVRTNVRYKVMYLPVDLVSRNVYKNLSFDEFMKPMTLSIVDNLNTPENEEVLGITGMITPENYEAIANSDDPYIRVGGGIELRLSGDLDMGGTFRNQNLYIKTDAQDQWVRLTPNGKTHFDYEELFTRTKLTEPVGYNDVNNQARDENTAVQGATYSGRSKHHIFTARNDFDIYNVAERYIVINDVLNTQNDAIDRTHDLTTGEVRYNTLGEQVLNNNHNIVVPDIDTYTFIGLRTADGKIYTNQQYAPLFKDAGYNETDIFTQGYGATAFDKDVTPNWTMIYTKARLKVNYITLDDYKKANGVITTGNVLLPSVLNSVSPSGYDATDYEKATITDDNGKEWIHYKTTGDARIGRATKIVDGILTAEITHIYVDLKTKEVPSSTSGTVIVKYVELGNHANELQSERVDVRNGVVSNTITTIEYYIDENGNEVEVNRTVNTTPTNAQYNTDETGENPQVIEKDGEKYVFIRHDVTSDSENGMLEVGTKEVVYEYVKLRKKEVPSSTSGTVIVKYVELGNHANELQSERVDVRNGVVSNTITTIEYYIDENGNEVEVNRTVNTTPTNAQYNTDETGENPQVIEKDGEKYVFIRHDVTSDSENGMLEVGTKEVVYEYVKLRKKEVPSSTSGTVIVKYVELGNHANELQSERVDVRNGVVSNTITTIEYYIDENGNEVEVNRTVNTTPTNAQYNTDETGENPQVIEKDGEKYVFIRHDVASDSENGMLEVGTKEVVYEYVKLRKKEVPSSISGTVIVKYVELGNHANELQSERVDVRNGVVSNTITTIEYYIDENGNEVEVNRTVNTTPINAQYNTDETGENPQVIEKDGEKYVFIRHDVTSDSENGMLEVGTKEVVYEYALVQEEVTSVVTETGEVVIRFVPVGDVNTDLTTQRVDVQPTAIRTTVTSRRYYIENGKKVYVGDPIVKVTTLDLSYDTNEVPRTIFYNGVTYRLVGHYKQSALQNGMIVVGRTEVIYEYQPEIVPTPQTTPTNPKTPHKVATSTLPKTGTATASDWHAFGMLSLVVSIGVLRKRKKDNE